MSQHKPVVCSPLYCSSSSKKRGADRFIPQTICNNLYSRFVGVSKTIGKYYQLLDESLFGGNKHLEGKLLKFNCEDKYNNNDNMVLHGQNGKNCYHCYQRMDCYQRMKGCRYLPQLPHYPYKILSARGLKDDFYLNLLDWGYCGSIAVGQYTALRLWSGCNSEVTTLYDSTNQHDYICSLGFLKHSGAPKIIIGGKDGGMKLFDIDKCRYYHIWQRIHSGRVGSMGCTNNLVVTGGKDGYISIQDVREERYLMRYRGHRQEICGLKVSPAGDMIASGGNDNRLVLYSLRKMGRMVSWDYHKAAVKAIGFNPHQPVIASGGGTADRKLRVFCLNTLELLSYVDTGSQVCNLIYSPISNELLATHGYSLNQLSLWKCGAQGKLQKADALTGHSSRVLYLAGEQYGGRVVTGAGDQLLKLWNVFDGGEPDRSSDLR